jgi:hypothetical protein
MDVSSVGEPFCKVTTAAVRMDGYFALIREFFLIFSLTRMKLMKNIWTFDNEKYRKMKIMGIIRRN